MLSLSGRLEMNYEACTHRYDYSNVPSYKIERLRSLAKTYGYEGAAEFLLQHLCTLNESSREWNVDMAIMDLVENHRLLVIGYDE